MSRIPKNVQQYLDQSNKLETSIKYAGGLKTGNVKADWFQRDFQRLQNLGTTAGHKGREDAKHAAGLRTGVEAVKQLRQTRLKELYEADALRFEQELHTLGLSLVKPRD